mgnify:CR=1 FL=1
MTPKGTVEGNIDIDMYGPGFSVIRFSGIADDHVVLEFRSNRVMLPKSAIGEVVEGDNDAAVRLRIDANWHLGWTLFQAGRYADAERVLRANYPDSSYLSSGALDRSKPWWRPW